MVYCSNCGTFNDDNNFRCIQCGNILQTAPQGPMPGQGYYPSQEHVPSNMGWAIASLLFCGLLGIIPILYASQVNKKLQYGDVEGAMESSNKAKTWGMIMAIGGGVITIIYIFAIFAGVLIL